MSLTYKLRLQLNLFMVNLMDWNSVQIDPECPHHPMEIASIHALTPHLPAAFQQVYVVLDNLKVSTLAVRWDITDVVPHDAQIEVYSEKISPCVMSVTFSWVSKNLVYLFPVNSIDWWPSVLKDGLVKLSLNSVLVLIFSIRTSWDVIEACPK
jgi:hypothetical protein